MTRRNKNPSHCFGLRSKFPSPLLSALGLALSLSTPGSSHAFTYSASYINDWSSCDSACNGNSSLSYTDDQINGFDAAMVSLGHRLRHRYSNSSVYASDYTEDSLGGKDNDYSDDSDIVVYSGHGGAPVSSGRQTFIAPMCKRGTVSSCDFRSSNARFGEQAGTYSSPHPGATRWLMWLTCYSVDTAPNEQWGDAFYQGLEIVMGYRGTSADSPTTDEVPGDWVTAALDNGDTFKAAWFWAIEDWWVDDTGALASAGPDAATSALRRDLMSQAWKRRDADDYGNWVSWSWYEG